MRKSLSMLLILAFAATVRAEEPKPNTLTPKEIADGWILLFDGESTFGWKSEGTVRTHDGSLVLSGQTETSVQTASRFGSDFEAKFAFRSNRDGELMAGVTSNKGLGPLGSLNRAEEWAEGSITSGYDRTEKTASLEISSRAKKSGGSVEVGG